MRFFHTTDQAEAILRNGFRDATGSYMLVGTTLTGVFISNLPLDSQEGAEGRELLEISLPDTVDLTDLELVEDEKPYREWCVPAKLLNEQSQVRLVDRSEREDLW